MHYRKLKLHHLLEMVTTNIQGAVKFSQEPWIVPYIDISKLRSKGTSEFEKDFFKLLDNSVFGKTMENL